MEAHYDDACESKKHHIFYELRKRANKELCSLLVRFTGISSSSQIFVKPVDGGQGRTGRPKGKGQGNAPCPPTPFKYSF